uniref:Uncharacterized protein n=1 Tax=Rhizophagus irregularis (strain DAOM 181602 / DAOM 197198 / MUCL 43194) TaxID=747089 RepID=U9UUN0_RHIID
MPKTYENFTYGVISALASAAATRSISGPNIPVVLKGPILVLTIREFLAEEFLHLFPLLKLQEDAHGSNRTGSVHWRFDSVRE